MNEINNRIKRLINKYDPMVLIRQGAPGNEYELEAQKISTFLKNGITASELEKEIRKIFIKSFDEDMVGGYNFSALTKEILAKK